MPSGQIALQLYTVRDRASMDFLGTLGAVADIGYGAVELAGYHGVPVPEVRAALDRHGLRAVAAHVPFEDFDTRADDALAELAVLGCTTAVLPSVPPERRSIDEAAALAALLDTWATRCRDAGLRFAYHNHAFELERAASGETLLERLAATTDPGLVFFELDVYWVRAAGADPAELVDRYAGRVPLLHLKDMGPDGADAPVGEGSLAWPELLEAAARARVEWYVVEQDEPSDSLRDVEVSLRNAQRLLSRGHGDAR